MNKCIGLLLLISSLVIADDKVEIEDTIKGNQQHPNVLFIVPWQTPDAAVPQTQKMAIRLPDYLTQPIERADFIEQTLVPSKNP
jgi:hypothetical protein